MLTSAVTMATGDTFAQGVEARSGGAAAAGYSPLRTAIACGWNALIFTPVFKVWFGFLDGRYPGGGGLVAVKKVILNQVLISLPINGAFLGYTTVCEQLLIEGAVDGAAMQERFRRQIWEDLPEVFLGSAALWLPVNLARPSAPQLLKMEVRSPRSQYSRPKHAFALSLHAMYVVHVCTRAYVREKKPLTRR